MTPRPKMPGFSGANPTRFSIPLFPVMPKKVCGTPLISEYIVTFGISFLIIDINY